MSFLTGCECNDDSHNVSACPTGDVAMDCPDHKTNCIIRSAPWGLAPFGPFLQTFAVVNASVRLTNFQH